MIALHQHMKWCASTPNLKKRWLIHLFTKIKQMLANLDDVGGVFLDPVLAS